MIYILITIWIISLGLLQYYSSSLSENSDTSLLTLFLEAEKDHVTYFVLAILIVAAPIILCWEFYEQYLERNKDGI